jgi:homocysteine S-methyltransferase
MNVAVFADIGPIHDGNGANLDEEYKRIIDYF